MDSINCSPKRGETQIQTRKELERQAIIFFRVLVRLYNKSTVKESLGMLDTTFCFSGAANTIVHQAVEYGFLKLSYQVFIDEIGFNPDYYTPNSRQTLVHTLIKYRAS